MANVPDSITLGELCAKAAKALTRAGLDRRIDIYREIEVDDPAVRLMLGRAHRVRVRVKITATSLLFESNTEQPHEADAPNTETNASGSAPDTAIEAVVGGSSDPLTTQR